MCIPGLAPTLDPGADIGPRRQHWTPAPTLDPGADPGPRRQPWTSAPTLDPGANLGPRRRPWTPAPSPHPRHQPFTVVPSHHSTPVPHHTPLPWKHATCHCIQDTRHHLCSITSQIKFLCSIISYIKYYLSLLQDKILPFFITGLIFILLITASLLVLSSSIASIKCQLSSSSWENHRLQCQMDLVVSPGT